MKTWWE